MENRFMNQTNPKYQPKSLLYKYLQFMLRYNNKDNPGNLSVELSQREINIWTMGNTNIPTKIYREDHITDIIEEFGEKVQSANIFLKVKEIFPATSVYNLDENRRGCKFWFETRDLKIFKFYSDSACEIECLRNAQIHFCGCVFHTLPNQLGMKQTVCNQTGVECAFKQKDEISAFLSTQCDCSINCHFFDVSIIGKYPMKSENENDTGKLRLNIITRAPSLQYISDVKQELLDFIVSIGGAITLFIGCSFLSLFQIIYYFLLKPLSARYFLKERPKYGRFLIKPEGNKSF
ncbi:unnamed protein product [Ceutorhynchus assimilis]|uniref:Uncharacterized protein n=1 Tax=Ceutorhynchus assimilis TaxID=467358 RepID=A0A9N9QIX6_9CUCU|nr:unnamed protein product [Ceutorhynchus assimilis]